MNESEYLYKLHTAALLLNQRVEVFTVLHVPLI